MYSVNNNSSGIICMYVLSHSVTKIQFSETTTKVGQMFLWLLGEVYTYVHTNKEIKVVYRMESKFSEL